MTKVEIRCPGKDIEKFVKARAMRDYEMLEIFGYNPKKIDDSDEAIVQHLRVCRSCELAYLRGRTKEARRLRAFYDAKGTEVPDQAIMDEADFLHYLNLK